MKAIKKAIKQAEREVDEISPLSHGSCFMIIPRDDNGRLSDWAFTIDPLDAYAPKHKTGVHNLSLRPRGMEGIDKKT